MRVVCARFRAWLLLVSWLSAAACQPAADGGSARAAGPDASADAAVAAAAAAAAEPLVRPALCDRPGDDPVRDVFCADQRPSIGNLRDLEKRLHLSMLVDVTTELRPGRYLKGIETTYSSVVLLGHSTALSGALVSPLNPRVILFSYATFLAFTRGLQQVEIVTRDRGVDAHFNFYLLDFRQACNAKQVGCTNGDLFTARIESDWHDISLRDAEDLKNTSSDCRQCHQRGLDKPTLLMRELQGPWTHFFGPDADDPKGVPEPTGSALTRDYLAAKGDEDYAGVPTNFLRRTAGFSLEGVVNVDQPLIFDASAILNERWPWHDGYPAQPERSKTWDDAFDGFKRGEQLALPYYAPRVTDADKLQQLTAAYQAYRSGALAADDLPDFSDVFPDDPQTRAEIGLQTVPGSTPPQAPDPGLWELSQRRARSVAFARALQRGDRALAALGDRASDRTLGTAADGGRSDATTRTPRARRRRTREFDRLVARRHPHGRGRRAARARRAARHARDEARCQLGLHHRSQ